MVSTIRGVEFYHATVVDQGGEGHRILSSLADLGINLLAFTAVPLHSMRTQLTLFPEDTHKMAEAARLAGITLDGPYPALLIQGDDELGVLARVHDKLYEANVNVYASTAVADGRGSFGIIVYVKQDDFDRALEALDLS